jgi:hypothetical protein
MLKEGHQTAQQLLQRLASSLWELEKVHKGSWKICGDKELIIPPTDIF